MTDADHLDLVLVAAEEFADRLGLCLDGAGGSLLYQDVTVLTMFESEEHQVHGLLQRHDESCHLRFRQRYGIPLAYLVNPERDDTAAATHHVAIARAADLRVTAQTRLRHGNLLLDGLRDTHRIDRICSFVRAETDHTLHARIDGRIQRVVRTDHIRLHRLHGEKLAGGDLFQRGSMEHIVHALHRIFQCALVAHVADVELHLMRHFRHTRLEVMTHIILFLLIAAEDTNLPDVRTQETVQHCITKTTCAACNQEDFVFKYTHFFIN